MTFFDDFNLETFYFLKLCPNFVTRHYVYLVSIHKTSLFYKEALNPKCFLTFSYQVEGITDKLLDTFRGNPDEDWWSKVIAERSYGSGRSEFKGIFKALGLDLVKFGHFSKLF